jgi:hypothetical protein
MAEELLRQYAWAARDLVHLMMPEHEATPLRHRLDEALALPPGTAFRALYDALRAHPVLRELVDQQRLPPQHRSRAHHLDVEAPRRVPVGAEFSVEVAVTGTPRGRSTRLPELDPSVGHLIVSLSTPDFDVLNDMRQKLPLPSGAEPSRIEFGLRGTVECEEATIRVRAYAGGTPVGEVTVTLAVGPGSPAGDGNCVRGELSRIAPDARDVTLEVSRSAEGLSMALVGSGAPVPAGPVLAAPITSDPAPALTRLHNELNRLAEGRPALEATHLKLRNLGIDLWAQTVPPEIRDQFWTLPETVTSLHIRTDRYPLPFELLHPLDGDHDDGFLVERFDVVRQAAGRPGAPHLPARQAAFVRPRNAPSNFDDETGRVAEALGAGTRAWRPVTSSVEMNALLRLPPTVIHIPSHLAPDLALRFDDGYFTPTDTAAAVQSVSLSPVAPIVFFNACRSAGEIPGFAEPVDWAGRLMKAGAGAFVGTLWPVDSRPASAFATAFYQRLAGGGTLAQAMRDARAAVRGPGDPTWLAYTLYGDPGARMRP